MKKKFKKIASLVLAMVMAFAMAVPAMASGISPVEGNATIEMSGEHYEGHTYNVYQIFTADVALEGEGDEQEQLLSNVKYGQNYGTPGDPVPESVLNGIKENKDFAKTIYGALIDKDHPYGTLSQESGYTLNNVPKGYYLIVDEGAGDTTDVFSAYIVEVIQGTVSITPKADVPTFDKKVKEKNDTTGNESGWQEVADYDIGDDVPFLLTATLPNADELARFDTYKLVFHDNMDPGLTLNRDSITVKIDGTDVDKSLYTVTTTGLGDECDFEVTINDAKVIPGATGGSEITVEFTAKLNTGAVIGQSGNLNKAKLQYSNNPYDEGLGETPEEIVTVFTFELIVNKVTKGPDGEMTPLEGAGFTLYKVFKDGDKKATSVGGENTSGPKFT